MEVAFKNREEFVFHITIAKKVKGKLVLVQQEQNLDFQACQFLLKKTGNFTLLITGKPIVHKKLHRWYDQETELIAAMVPDAKSHDFSAQAWQYNGQFFGSLIRSDLLDKILDLFSAARCFPEQINIGSYSGLVLPILAENDELEINTFNTLFTFRNGTLEQLSVAELTTKHPLQMGSDTVKNENLTGFCTIFNTLAMVIVTTPTQHAKAHYLTDEQKHKKRFKTILYSSALTLFVLVMANFFYNQHLTSKHVALEEELALNQQALSQIEKLEIEIAEKKSLIGKGFSSSGPVIGQLADELAATVPADIRLTNMEIFPLSQKIQKEKPVFFSFNKIVIEGICNQPETLDKWIQHCKTLKWTKDLSLVKYQFNEELAKGLFKIELQL